MKLSTKVRYGLACSLYIASKTEKVAVQAMAFDLGLSALYLQQVMTALKVGGIVTSTKGSNGGYELTKDSNQISVFEIMVALDPTLIEKSEPATSNRYIDTVLQMQVFEPLEEAIQVHLSKTSLHHLSEDLKKHQGEALMFYI